MSPDGSAFACIVDDGGYPRAVQRFLSGRRTTSARWVQLPVDGPITRVIHSADGRWLACQVAPHGGNRTQVWVVTTDPDDRAARRLGTADDPMVELVGWDGTLVALVATDEEGVAEARLVDPSTHDVVVLDRRSGGHLVDAWRADEEDGYALLRVGPRGYRELLLLSRGEKAPLLPADPGSTTEMGIILDDHSPAGPANPFRRSGAYGARAYGDRILVRSDNGCEYARLLEVVASAEGTSYRVLAERLDCELDEFIVSDDTSTVALLWNIKGCSELQILNLADGSLNDPIALPGMVASELSISADGSLLAVTVQGPGMPPSVELVDPRTGEWGPVEPARTEIEKMHVPQLVEFSARDGTPLSGWLHRTGGPGPGPVLLYFHGGPEAQERPGYNFLFPGLVASGIAVFAPNVRGSSGYGRAFSHADDRYGRFAGIDDVADCVAYLVDTGIADPERVACAGRSYGGYLTLASLTFHAGLFATGVAICGMSDLESFYANTESWIAAAAYPKYGHPEFDRELLHELSPIHRIDDLVAPLLVVHGAYDTNVPVSESEQIVEALRERGRRAELLFFDDEGHEIVKRENKAIMSATIVGWLAEILAPAPLPEGLHAARAGAVRR
ncbi:prolyl oligopeptidase family serine peptidase [Aldersonia sp. NBC_00410]|uniref:alpha/beta hydrolase family protein n=1 Tax=Aldersonia sp. NBC_00410 TaxID=2975954 RepID=UPI002251970C|nr:prolyl oligopeptidase family serine peptidase [Aldersonia sp. NBC_00410]MCX5041611.1 prolyl oligopeptidase family serine peptidase [Aldersonia sp. NBC_00410]